jgi:hypothetical protein
MGSLNATTVSNGQLLRAAELYFGCICSLILDLTREAAVEGCLESFKNSRECRHHVSGCETSRTRWRHSVRCTTDVQARVFASIARKTRIDSPAVTVNNPLRTSARLTNPKVMAVVKTVPKSVAVEELNRLIAQKASTKIPITIRAQPIPMRRAEKNDSAGNCEFFMCWTFWPHHLPSGNPKRF